MTESLVYRSRRFPVFIDVEVAEDSIQWCYRSCGDEWRETLPLYWLNPYPQTRIDHSSYKIGFVSLVGLPVIACLVFWIAGFSYGSIFVISAASLLAICVTTFENRRGSIEWVTFDSYYRDKAIYFFRNRSDPEFDLVVKKLQAAILISSQSHFDNRQHPPADV